jgi:hypothetical protein
MAKWISYGNGFIEADVVRWKESVWVKRSRRRKAHFVNVGDRMVTDEVRLLDFCSRATGVELPS